jgi:hypothetical protein
VLRAIRAAPWFRDAVIISYGKSDGAAAPVDVMALLRTAAPLAMDTDEDDAGVDAGSPATSLRSRRARPRPRSPQVHPEKVTGG